MKVYFADEPWDNKPPPLYLKSTWRPEPEFIPPEVNRRLARFFRGIRRLFKIQRRGRSNLLPFQHKLLLWLKRQTRYLIAKTDKGLGPCMIEYERYVEFCLKHLSDSSTYETITEEQATEAASRIAYDIRAWVSSWRSTKPPVLDIASAKYILKKTADNMEDPQGYFYGMFKVHKMPLKIRPVCSDCASVTNALGKWVDVMLQPIAQSMPSFFKDSFELKSILDETVVPRGARLCSADAVSMYTNIPTEPALARLAEYLRRDDVQRQFPHYNAECLISALEIVMRNNIFRFGDLYKKQISGTAMGKPCAPPWATIFQGLREIDYVPRYKIYLPLYLRFIDDVFLMWVPFEGSTDDEDNVTWSAFQAEVNDNCGLEWEFTDRGMKLDFMDMTISIVGDKLITTLFEKPMATFLYIPPHSAHPPGVTIGHIMGEVLRIHRLCSYEHDVTNRVCTFFGRLLRRGHNASDLIPKFIKALDNARQFLRTSKADRDARKAAKAEEARRRVYFHRTYHPQGPTSREIQRLFEEEILRPLGRKPFQELLGRGREIPVDAMIVANHRAPNLGNYFSYRKLSNRNGPPVSSFL